MKKINKYILWLLPVFGLFACEDEMGVYNSPENTYLLLQSCRSAI